MIIIKMLLAVLVSCGNQAFDLSIEKAPKKQELERLWSDFVRDVYYDIEGSLSLINPLSIEKLEYISLFEKAIKSKPICLMEDKSDMSSVSNFDIGNCIGDVEVTKIISSIRQIKISFGSFDAFLEKSIPILSLISQRELLVERNERIKIEVVDNICLIYAKLELIAEKSIPQTQLMYNISRFLLQSLPFLQVDFLNRISCNQEEKVGNFFVIARQSYKYYRDKPRLQEFLFKYLDGKDKDSVRKYCKKLSNVLPVHFLANKYMGASLDKNIVTLKDLFNLFLKNWSLENEVWSISFLEYLFKKSTAIDDVFWLLSDFLSIDDLPVMSLGDGKLIHQYLAINHPEHLVKFIHNLRDSLDDDKDSIFNLVGLSRLPNFGILLLNKHGIKKFREIELELVSETQQDFLIFANNDPILMLVELFQRYAIDCKDDLQYEVRSILIVYCKKLLEKYSIFIEKKEFNLFINLYDPAVFRKESELESYIEKIKQDILYVASLNLDNFNMINKWYEDYQKLKGNRSEKPPEKSSAQGFGSMNIHFRSIEVK